MKMYKIYWEGDLQAEFKTLKEAQDYIKADIKGTAETYNKSQKWVKANFKWEIVKEESV